MTLRSPPYTTSVDVSDYLDEIEVAWEIGNIPDLSRSTRLTLAMLRKHRSSEDSEELHSRLSRLISPFEDVRGFKIELHIPLYPDLSGEVEPPELLADPK